MRRKSTPKIKAPKKEAGGIPSIVHALGHVFGEVGVVQGTASLLQLNQFNGFDCPGCAWPDPDESRSMVEFCENGAKAVAEEATTERCDPDFFRRHPVAELREWADFDIGKSGRLTHPMVLREGSQFYEPIEWPDAFRMIAASLKELTSPDEAVFYTSGRTSNEAAFLYQLFVRMFGTNNLPDCSNMCHESSGVALTETLGTGKGSVTLDDFDKTELVVIIGQNPGTNHPRMLTALQKAKRSGRGAKIITINPIPEAGLIGFRHPQNPLDLVGKATALTDLWLQVRINEDVALLKAILRMLLEREKLAPGAVLDHSFIQTKTEGYEALVRDLATHDLDDLIKRSGVPRQKLDIAVDWLSGCKRIIVCWAMGLTQHRNAVDNIREIVNLLLLKGSIGKPGAGTCPVRGHSNVQGDRTMGICEKPKEEFLNRLKVQFGFPPPLRSGYDTVETIQAMADGKVKIMFALGGNFLAATPDTRFTAAAIAKCDLTVHVSTKLNRSHLVHGRTALILPCLGRTEQDLQQGVPQFVTVENSAGVVHRSQGGKKPASPHLRSEVGIVAGLAMATLTGENASLVDWSLLAANYDRIRDLIEKVIPGFNDFNERVRKDGGFYLPNAAREGTFTNDSQRALFTINKVADHRLKAGEFILMTVRSHDQYNTTIYGLDDRYRGVYGDRRVVFVNPRDLESAGVQAGDRINMVSNYDGMERIAEDFRVVPYDIPAGNLAAYFPEANVLVPANRFAHGSQTPISKSVVVKIARRG